MSVSDCINHAIAVIYILSMENISNMIKVSAAEFQRNIGRYQDMALTQPVVVARNGRERTVMISVEEYHRLKRRDRRVMGLEDFSDEDIAALERTRAPAGGRGQGSALRGRSRHRRRRRRAMGDGAVGHACAALRTRVRGRDS